MKKPVERIVVPLLAVAATAAGSFGVLMLEPQEQPAPGVSIAAIAPGAGASNAAPLPKLQGRLSEMVIQDAADAPPGKIIEASLTGDAAAEVTPGANWSTDTESASENPDTWSSSVLTPPPQTAVPVIPDKKAAAIHGTAGESVAPSAIAPPPSSQPLPTRSYSLSERLAEISPAATSRLTEKFAAAKAQWPPAEMALVAVKDQKSVELHVRSAASQEWTFVYRYPVLAASGTSGPKLREGDRQVPEGIYDISLLNPNSKYHVSLRVNYPNAFDREMASKDGRSKLGGDIMIHGKNVSIGCLAVGDAAAEELFVLASQVGLPKVKVIIAPSDFRSQPPVAAAEGQPKWLPKLYSEVASAMMPFKAPPPEKSLLSLLGL